MFKRDKTGCAATRTATTLEKVAAALECPVSAFSEPHTGDHAETAELLRLWAMIEPGQDRAKVLSFLRNVASQTSPSNGSNALSGS